MTLPEIRRELAKGAFIRLQKNDDGTFQLVGKTAKNREYAGARMTSNEVVEAICMAHTVFTSADTPGARALVAELVGFAEEAQAAYPELIPELKRIIDSWKTLRQLPCNYQPSPEEVN